RSSAAEARRGRGSPRSASRRSQAAALPAGCALNSERTARSAAPPLLLAAIAILGCSRGTSPSRPVDPAAASTPAPPQAVPSQAETPAAATPSKPPTLIVGGEEGLRELRYDGSLVRALSKTPARRPRIMPSRKEVLFYVKASGEIRKLSLE